MASAPGRCDARVRGAVHEQVAEHARGRGQPHVRADEPPQPLHPGAQHGRIRRLAQGGREGGQRLALPGHGGRLPDVVQPHPLGRLGVGGRQAVCVCERVSV